MTAIDAVISRLGTSARDAALWLCHVLSIAPATLGYRDAEATKPRQAEENRASTPFELIPWQYRNPTTMRPRQWLLGTLLMRGELTVLASAGGVGKTALAIAAALACMTGREDILGHYVFQKVNVAFLTLEDDRAELERRIAAAMIAHGIKPEDIEGKLLIYSARERPFLLAAVDDDGEFIPCPDADALEAEIANHDIGLVVVDPLVKAHRAIENSNEHMDKLASLIIDMGSRTNAAMLTPCHNRKGGEIGRDAIRGGTALVDAARIARIVSAMREGDALKLGMKADDAASYICLHDVKANMARRHGVTWFELRSIPLGNTEIDEYYQSGDHVHAAAPWEPPSPFEGLPLPLIADIFEKIRRGPEPGEFYTRSRQAKDWVGDLIVRAGIGKTEDQAAIVVALWCDNGVLTTGQYNSPKRNRRKTERMVLNEAKAAEVLALLRPVAADDE